MSEIFSKNLRHYRQKAGYSSAKDMAKALGLSYTTYIHYENKGSEPRYDILCQIARLLNVTPDTLLGFAPADEITPAPAMSDEQELLRRAMELAEYEIIDKSPAGLSLMMKDADSGLDEATMTQEMALLVSDSIDYINYGGVVRFRDSHFRSLNSTFCDRTRLENIANRIWKEANQARDNLVGRWFRLVCDIDRFNRMDLQNEDRKAVSLFLHEQDQDLLESFMRWPIKHRWRREYQVILMRIPGEKKRYRAYLPDFKTGTEGDTPILAMAKLYQEIRARYWVPAETPANCTGAEQFLCPGVGHYRTEQFPKPKPRRLILSPEEMPRRPGIATVPGFVTSEMIDSGRGAIAIMAFDQNIYENEQEYLKAREAIYKSAIDLAVEYSFTFEYDDDFPKDVADKRQAVLQYLAKQREFYLDTGLDEMERADLWTDFLRQAVYEYENPEGDDPLDYADAAAYDPEADDFAYYLPYNPYTTKEWDAYFDEDEIEPGMESGEDTAPSPETADTSARPAKKPPQRTSLAAKPPQTRSKKDQA